MFRSTPLRALCAGVVAATAFAAAPGPASAQPMFLGQIFPVAFNFCPRGSAAAEGQILSINENQALYSLYGTTFGGDGRTSFGLPDLRGRTPIHEGTGPGLANRRLGSKGGAERRTLTENQLPPHSHDVRANNLDGDLPGPGGKLLAAAPTGGSGNETIYSELAPTVTMSPQMISPTGGSQPTATLDPTIVIRYCVNLVGIFPSRD